MPTELARRPLATRERASAKALARALDRAGISPNAISIASLVFALAAGCSIFWSGETTGALRIVALLAGAALIQLRLLCNMLDGMVAVEGGHKTPLGEMFNDMPDRFADLAILLGTGYSLAAFPWGIQLGWLAGTLALLTAYVRLLGGSMGARQHFVGPMAKPQRMAVLTVACLLSALEPLVNWHGQILAFALALIAAGSLVTIVCRTRLIAGELKAR
jgi:phosphatidylglycerophosphate synthase